MSDTVKTAMREAFDAAARRQQDIYRSVIESAESTRPAMPFYDMENPVIAGLHSDAGIKRRRQQWSVQRGARK